MEKKERRLYDPNAAAEWVPRKTWVEMSDGSEVCCWELSVPEAFRVAESGQRHPQDPTPGQNQSEEAIWLIALSARRDDTPKAPRIWNDLDVGKLVRIAPSDFTRLLIAARFLLQGDEAAEAAEVGFTGPAPAASGRKSPTGVSSNSTVSLVS